MSRSRYATPGGVLLSLAERTENTEESRQNLPILGPRLFAGQGVSTGKMVLLGALCGLCERP